MSNQKPLKIVNLELLNSKKEREPEALARIYKDNNHKAKQALAFKTDADKPKLA